DVVDAVARGAVGHRLAPRAQRQAVVAVGERRHLVARQVVPLGQALVGVAAPAGHAGHAGGIDERLRLAGRQDRVLAVAVGAHRRPGHAPPHGFAVDAGRVGVADLAVAGPAGFGDLPVVDLRLLVAAGADPVGAVAVRAGRRGGAALQHRAAVDAQAIGLEGPS